MKQTAFLTEAGVLVFSRLSEKMSAVTSLTYVPFAIDHTLPLSYKDQHNKVTDLAVVFLSRVMLI